MSPPRVLRRVRWRNLDRPGAETATFARTAAGVRLSGRVRLELAEGSVQVRYRIDCARDWSTRDVWLEQRVDAARRVVTMQRHDGRWTVSGIERPDLEACLDVDLAITPSTNTLPIRRLEIPVGGSVDIVAAWVQVPDLTVTPSRQRYSRVADRRYGFLGLANHFTAELDVDDLGIVVDYPGYWERAGSAGRRLEKPQAAGGVNP